ncbi:MAG: 8-oxo-dGTP diphosphatase [Candidatus Nanoarchaeia archaeon]
MKTATLVYPIKDNKMLVGMKKKGFGEGKINGFGGKVEKGETIEQAAVRELFEEISLKAKPEHLKKVAELNFYFPHLPEKGWDQVVHVYFLYNWEGLPKESDEMGYEWFEFDKFPYHKSWDDDQYWLPLVLKGKHIKGNITFGKDGHKVEKHELTETKW